MIPSFVASLILFIPAFIANPSAVITGGHLIIDGGKTWKGKRIFGDHKTWSGFLGGIIAGTAIGLILNYLFLYFNVQELVFSAYLAPALAMVLTLSLFSMLGDLVGSFIKRRIGRAPGAESLFLDQYPFALFALAFFYIAFLPEARSLFPWEGVIAILVVTPLIHRAVNIIGYKLKMKSVPY
ncbi:MAG: CDP-2,3-bis-(O-geranylgeranyl)-sn-glycerol synthase [Thermoplasmatales archaeon]|nr:CDP-2,3-bis-(O-geranylgeranyl)-sn-glycerol synthase [Candidatus Thermoplasmatota archaeon]MCL6003480.1 CDP-2,3-bis-(O-geranylgeranyl)-sn-glycerol synthase [Candidatus Thermoplasmatota archaeon]MDA8054409.1 CDP-2,3-bis-(O-geranylgeranyl)-sn-glycerol synthase [Thermoplasmatales archaeon]